MMGNVMIFLKRRLIRRKVRNKIRAAKIKINKRMNNLKNGHNLVSWESNY